VSYMDPYKTPQYNKNIGQAFNILEFFAVI
jgi:hypothetical protein